MERRQLRTKKRNSSHARARVLKRGESDTSTDEFREINTVYSSGEESEDPIGLDEDNDSQEVRRGTSRKGVHKRSMESEDEEDIASRRPKTKVVDDGKKDTVSKGKDDSAKAKGIGGGRVSHSAKRDNGTAKDDGPPLQGVCRAAARGGTLTGVVGSSSQGMACKPFTQKDEHAQAGQVRVCGYRDLPCYG